MRYAMKKVRNIVGRDIATGKNKFVLSDLKSLTISGSSDVVWADGADGAHLVGFDTNNTVEKAFKKIEEEFNELKAEVELYLIKDK